MRAVLLATTFAFLTTGASLAQDAAKDAPREAPKPAPRPAAICATAEQVKQIAEYYTASPGMLPPNAVRALKMPEAAIVSGLPKEQSAVVSGAEFQKIWESMTTWPDALGLIMKSGHVFEVMGPIKPGEQSARSNFFNVGYGGGLGGHLRPDLVSTIAVVAIPGKDGAMVRGVLFYDGAGDSGFGVFVPPGPDAKPKPEVVATFEKTFAFAQTLPRACS